MAHRGRLGKRNVKAQNRRWIARKFVGGNMENLDNWKPQHKLVYNGYNRYSNTDASSGKVLIHLENNQYIGGFFIEGANVKIWYHEGHVKKEINVPTVLCKFTKRREDNTNIYDVVIDEDKYRTLYGINESSKQTPSLRPQNHNLPYVYIAILVLVVVVIGIAYLKTPQSTSASDNQNQLPNTTIQSYLMPSNTTYLSQSQLYSIYGVGAYSSINTNLQSKEVLNGSSLSSFIQSGTQIANFSIPQIAFQINTSIQNITIGKSFLTQFNRKTNGQEQVVLIEEVISSPQASYLFYQQASLAIYDGDIGNMQYYVIGNTEVIANQDNYVIILKCDGLLCTNQTLNQTIEAVSKDNI